MHPFLTSGGRPQLTLTNNVTNSSFVNTTGWTPTNATDGVLNGEYLLTGNGSATQPSAVGTTSITIGTQKIYVKVKAISTDAACNKILVQAKGSTSGAAATTVSSVDNPVVGASNILQFVLTMPGTLTGQLQIYANHRYVDAGTSNNKTLKISEVMAIDLTAIFGAGREPTAAQMYRWLQIFSQGWFAITKAIPKRIY
jgi:hypothetical protein